jgi:myo-inositol catabolism protein IolH
VKLAVDAQMFHRTHAVTDLPDAVARAGYAWMELSPKEDFIPFFAHPRVDSATVATLRRRAADAGVGISSVLPVLRWSGPDEDARQAAVRAWRRAIQIAVDLGVDTMNSEFNGRPEGAEHREGIRLVLEPHPDDFIEDGHAAVNMVAGLDRDWVRFLYCTPHTFHQGGDAAGIIAHAGRRLTNVHLADTLDHTASGGLRYIVNPPGSTVRVHQHSPMGAGEVDFDEVFAALASAGFDGTLTHCVFGWEERASEIVAADRTTVTDLVAKHFGSDAVLEPAPGRTST